MSEQRTNSKTPSATSAVTWISEFERAFIVAARIRNEKARRIVKGINHWKHDERLTAFADRPSADLQSVDERLCRSSKTNGRFEPSTNRHPPENQKND